MMLRSESVRQETPSGRGHGGYEILTEIARGGMATVYLCRRTAEAGFSRLFALKLMHPHLAAEEEFVRMMLDEARLASRLHHPNVIGTLDLGRCKDSYYLVMEYVEGCSLSQLVTQSGEHRPDCIAAVVVDALLGLDALHRMTDENGVPLHSVHRDVSPQNILIGLDGAARLTDFGIAHAAARLSTTRPGLLKGKFEYLAPEQIDSAQTVDHRADIFSAGVVLWNALTGRSLFHGAHDVETIRNVVHAEIAPPSTVGFCPPSALDHVVLRALDRDPSQRYATAGEMAEALRRAALEAGMYAWPQDVAAWVDRAFGARLAERRKLIREAASGVRPIFPTSDGDCLSLPSSTGSIPSGTSVTPNGSLPLRAFVPERSPVWTAVWVAVLLACAMGIGAGAAWMVPSSASFARAKASSKRSPLSVQRTTAAETVAVSKRLPRAATLKESLSQSAPAADPIVLDLVRVRAAPAPTRPRRVHRRTRGDRRPPAGRHERSSGARQAEASGTRRGAAAVAHPEVEGAAETSSGGRAEASGTQAAGLETGGEIEDLLRLEANPYVKQR